MSNRLKTASPAGASAAETLTPEVRPGPAFVSGGAGFAGRHLVRHLKREGVEVLAPDRGELDLGDAAAVRALLASNNVSTCFHLAAFSSPSLSLQAPADALLGNVAMTLNLLEAVRHEAPEATVVLIGSGQVYGEPTSLPATEESPLEPGNPYAVSKATGDLLGHQYEGTFGIKVLRMRPFNHAGPGQTDHYVVSTLARQVAAAEAAGKDLCILRTGSPDSARDFTDVRDVAAAYVAAADLTGGAFNVCRGSATSVAELVSMLAAESRLPIRHEVDPGRLRANEVPTIYGSSERLRRACGWRPTIPLAQTIRDTLDWWRTEFSQGSV